MKLLTVLGKRKLKFFKNPVKDLFLKMEKPVS
ncbi:hypothetical protein SAMN04515674_11697 [Pseudarcicella hirudinis]|uniref:Uncharacterized protein n=1 Tax=Pseudarcicella hirudinis TaxID=1079859 RepID=A0A1I5Y1D6_9BACT|nr:hypothetical protein SAMN04515674_11697 [Pseudarcicella hirudinis]